MSTNIKWILFHYFSSEKIYKLAFALFLIMACPSRKHQAVANMMNIREKRKNDSVKPVEEEKITPEEHEARVKMLKELGLIK